MHLLEAIVDGNQRAVAAGPGSWVLSDSFGDQLPLAALTCIDPRLNSLFPECLGLTPEQFIWLRNAGNIVTTQLSSTVRSISLATAVKGAREIAIIGHSDCLVRKASALDLLNRFQALGVDRAQLPENLQEYFGLFSSERQNVLRGVELVRNSPLIGKKIPVHGLLIAIDTGKLEWLVNGYTATATTGLTAHLPAETRPLAGMPQFKMGDISFPQWKIGDVPGSAASQPGAVPLTTSELPAAKALERAADDALAHWKHKIDPALEYRIVGDDKNFYGPVSAAKLFEWIAEGRVHEKTLVQVEGDTTWTALRELTLKTIRRIPLPPKLVPGSETKKPFRMKSDYDTRS